MASAVRLSTSIKTNRPQSYGSDNETCRQRPVPLPARTSAHISDSNPNSPWSRKIVLCLDGGGIRGYSSLLIVKRLMSLVEQIEKGVRPRVNTSAIREEHESSVCSSEFYDKNSSSSEYPWHVEHCKTEQKAARSLQTHYETPEDIQESVKATFAQKGGSNFKPHHYFDYMAGTSTGGLSAIMLGRMEMSVEKALEQYDLVGNKVFGKPRRLHSKMKLANLLRPKFPARNMESAINQVIKSGLENEIRQWKHFRTEEVPFQSDSQKCRTLVVAHGPVNVTNTVHHTYIFRTYDHLHPSPMSDRENRTKHLNPGRAHRDPIWKVARATSAAPGYFSPIDFGGRTFRDGGMVANNPSSVALTEVLQMHEQRPKLLISIGCGLSELGDEEDTTRSEGGFVNRWTDTAIAASKILTQTEKTQEEVHTSYAFMPAVMYHRFNVGNGLGDIPLDQWKPANSGEKTKSTIEESTFNFLADPETHSHLLRCAVELVSVRRARAATVRWETFARDFIYCCTEEACFGAQASRTFLTRDELRDHGVQVHSFVLNVALKGRGHDSCQHACTFDQCHDDGVHVFDDQHLFEEHLLQVHDLEHPQYMDLRALEQWLDLGRMTQQAALKFRPSEMACKKREEREQKRAEEAKAAAVAAAVAAGLVRSHSTSRPGRKARKSLFSTPALRLDTDFATSSQPNSAAMTASPSTIPVITPTPSVNTLVNEVRGSR